jgi:uncharacterized membrane protein
VFAEKVRWLGGRAGTILTALLLLLTIHQFSQALATTNNPIISETLTLTVYLDGFVLVNHALIVNQAYPAVNVSLLGEVYESMLIVDDQDLPLDYSTANGVATVHSLGTSEIRISYFTQYLASKTGRLWTLQTDVSTNTTVIMPEDASIISLNNVPERIEGSDGGVIMVMPPGTIEITYIVEHDSSEQTENPEATLQLVAALSLLSIPIAASALWLIKRRKPKKTDETKACAVDVEKLFEREKDLRREEVQVIRFLAEKNGTAFEAELYERLDLPRTTTWRLLKRLEKMEVIDIRKSRRQNIVSIKRKYMRQKSE